MPQYTYKNLTTKELHTITQSIHDQPLERHPETGDPIKRIITPPAIRFNGTGFYSTDNKPPHAR
jgi:predicted nucleic acid-binding Zn ribbon protein